MSLFEGTKSYRLNLVLFHFVLLGHDHVVEMLLVAKADPTLHMGELTALDIARDFCQDSILKLLEDSVKGHS